MKVVDTNPSSFFAPSISFGVFWNYVLWFLYVEAFQLWWTPRCVRDEFTEHSCSLVNAELPEDEALTAAALVKAY